MVHRQRVLGTRQSNRHGVVMLVVGAAIAACSQTPSLNPSSGEDPSANAAKGTSGAAGASSPSASGSGGQMGGPAAGGASTGRGSGGRRSAGGSRDTGAAAAAGASVASAGSPNTSSGLELGGAGGGKGGNTDGSDLGGAGHGGAGDDASGVTRTQAPRPDAAPDSCGHWALTEGVCCAQYCTDDDRSESCDRCGGSGSDKCQVVNAKACTSGQWPEVHTVSDNEDWHYSRSTHFGTAPTGACAFGLYGICSSTMKLADSSLQARCDTFCKTYPDLCKDPGDTTLRGNFAAPQGNYYTQFWPSLPGDIDNYLSCGECFELVRTQDDGSEYTPASSEYVPPIVLQVADSCPCSANSKWCCGSGRDHCGEIKGQFQYGCPLPPNPPPPVDRDPRSDESIHLDLSDIAMARLQTGDPNGAILDGVVPTKYRRVPCPVVGNIHVWVRQPADPYYFALTVVNQSGLGAAAKVEAQLPSGDWVLLQRDKNYTMSRPQERYGVWALPTMKEPFELPVTLRITDGSGRAVVAKEVIKTWAPADKSQSETWFIDTGVQF